MRLLKIGRDISCDIVLHSDNVSALHAELVMLDSGDITIEDKNSRNGTYIMNQRIKPGKPVNIKLGDAVRFADVELQWSQVPKPEDNSAYKAIYGIGSHFNNDVQISGPTVSRYHATLKIGKDKKFYLFDHSKNGTTVDGIKIPSNTPYQITRKSVIVCGGVPANLSNVMPPGGSATPLMKVVAAVVIVLLLCFGIYALIKIRPIPDNGLYNRYNTSVVMTRSLFHYSIEIEGWTDDDWEKYNYLVSLMRGSSYTIPRKVAHFADVDLSNLSDVQIAKALNELAETNKDYDVALYGTAFFISDDGKLVTNLHIVKPWLFGDFKERLELLQKTYTQLFSENYAAIDKVKNQADYHQFWISLSGKLVSSVNNLKVKGVLDGISFCPNNVIFSMDHFKKCQVLAAGEDPKKDVAIIQNVDSELPKKCSFINVTDSMDISEKALKVGNHIYTLGFPNGRFMQKEDELEGIKLIAQGGVITQESTQYTFGFNAASMGGASGSPVFNNRGKLIGVLNSGYSIQGYNFGIKAIYIKELLDGLYKK